MADSQVGRCGAGFTRFYGNVTPTCCELPAGHSGWHRDGVTEWTSPLIDTAAAETLDRVRALVEHARKISPSERAVVYVTDIECELGMDTPIPHKTGQTGS